MKQEQEFQYMISELNLKETTLNDRINRFEQLVNFYITGITALTGVAALVMTSSLLGIFTLFSLTLIFFAFSGFGIMVYLRMVAAKMHITVLYVSRYAIQLYFTNQFPQAAPYVESRKITDLYNIWKAMFTNQVIFLLLGMNGLSSLFLSMGIGLLFIQINQLFGYQFLGIFEVIIICTAIFLLSELLLWFHLKTQMKQSRSHVCQILDTATTAVLNILSVEEIAS